MNYKKFEFLINLIFITKSTNVSPNLSSYLLCHSNIKQPYSFFMKFS